MKNKLHHKVTTPSIVWRSKQWRFSIPFGFPGLRYSALIFVLLTLFTTSGCNKAIEPEVQTPEQQIHQANQTFRSAVASAKAIEPEVQTPEQQIHQADQTFRSAVASALQEAAQQAGVKVSTGDFVAILPDDGSSVVVNAGIAGVENLSLDQLAQGADVLFIFLRLPQGSDLPLGFYTVRISQTPGTTKWRAQFKDLQGQVVLETDSEVSPGDPALQRYLKIKTIYWRGVIDLGGPKSSVRTSVGVGTGEPARGEARVGLGRGKPDTASLPPAGQSIVKAAADFYLQALEGIVKSQSNTYRQVFIGTRDDTWFAFTVFYGVENLTEEQLAQGQDVFFGYFRTPQATELPPGFYTVRILQSAGQWLARFVDARGNTVKEVAAEVGPRSTRQGVNLTGGIEYDGLRMIDIGDSTSVRLPPIKL